MTVQPTAKPRTAALPRKLSVAVTTAAIPAVMMSSLALAEPAQAAPAPSSSKALFPQLPLQAKKQLTGGLIPASQLAAQVPATVAAESAAPATHRIVPGDTVSSIAARYGLDLNEVLRINNLTPTSIIFAGKELKLTGTASAPAAEAPAKGTYTVEAGDSYYYIAELYEMTLDQLMDMNPGYDIDLLRVGDVLTISNAVPYLTVVNVERQRYVIDVPFEVEYEDDNSMYQGDYDVLSPGQYGKADVTANVTYINGEETDRETVASVLLVDPITELQARGTIPRPSWFPTGSFRWPCYGTLTSYFGNRRAPTKGASTNHGAIDIANSYGTPIYASDGGTVIASGWQGGLGYAVTIDHGNGFQTIYGHNSSLLVKAGDHVYKGQQIARMGSTGISTGNHCHFAVKYYGTYVDPLNYL